MTLSAKASPVYSSLQFCEILKWDLPSPTLLMWAQINFCLFVAPVMGIIQLNFQ